LVEFLFNKDYSEEFRDITKGRIKDTVPTGGIMLLTQKPVSDDLPVRSVLSLWGSTWDQVGI